MIVPIERIQVKKILILFVIRYLWARGFFTTQNHPVGPKISDFWHRIEVSQFTEPVFIAVSRTSKFLKKKATPRTLKQHLLRHIKSARSNSTRHRVLDAKADCAASDKQRDLIREGGVR